MAEKSRVQQSRGAASIKAGVRPAEGNSQGRKCVGRDETEARAGSSERPAVVAAKLMEGRIAIFVDGSPMALTLPCIFLEQFQSGEDYYVDVTFAAINRLLRVLGFVTAVGILPFYLSHT